MQQKLKKGQAALPRTTPKPQDTEKMGSGRGSRSGSRFEARFGKVFEKPAISGKGQELSGASLAIVLKILQVFVWNPWKEGSGTAPGG